MAFPLIALAAKLLPYASLVPEVMRVFGSDKSAEAAEAIVDVAKRVTGADDGEQAVNKIINDPALQLQFQQMLSAERIKFREMEYQDKQHAHLQQQETIRSGDNATDEYVRRTRPKMARQSWYWTAIYIIATETAKSLGYIQNGADWQIAMVLLTPAAAYLGFRTGDKFAEAWRGMRSVEKVKGLQ